MENAYGIGVKNRYQLFLDYDLLEEPGIQVEEKEFKKKTKLPENKGKPSSVTRKGSKETQNLKSPTTQKPKEGSNTVKSAGVKLSDDKHNYELCQEWISRKNQVDRPVGDPEKKVDDSSKQHANHSVAFENKKIETDRSPVQPNIKKGTDGEETSIQTTETVPQVEEFQKEMTLDEYKALRGPRQKPHYNLRKAGEGEDLSRWKKIYALEKKKEDFDETEEEEEYDRSEYPQRAGRQKHWFGIEIHFSDNVRSPGRGRGGRGMGRGGLRGGLPRPGLKSSGMPFRDRETSVNDRTTRVSHQIAPKVDDEHDFPSLS